MGGDDKMEDVTDGTHIYFRKEGKGYIGRGVINAEFSAFEPNNPNLNWINSHDFDVKKVLDFARTIKLLGLEGKVDE